jgi:hypothetical protein
MQTPSVITHTLYNISIKEYSQDPFVPYFLVSLLRKEYGVL